VLFVNDLREREIAGETWKKRGAKTRRAG